MARKIVIPFLCFFISCGSNECRRQNQDFSNERVISPEEAFQDKPQDLDQDKVWIYKYDGSVFCGTYDGVTVLTMQKELNGIRVFASEKKSDEFPRSSTCNFSTGIANRYLILKQDLPEALNRGFQVWDLN